MTERWWAVAAPDGRLLPWTFGREADVARLKAEDAGHFKWPTLEADGYRVVQVEVRRV